MTPRPEARGAVEPASPLNLPALPVSAVVRDLDEALRGSRRAVLVAPPGSGKTTLVPLHLQRAGWLGSQRIVMLEPRRVAARAAATRMASLLGEQVGETVGYAVRGERKVSAKTRIEVVTEGLLSRRLQRDPSLEGIGVLIFDEFHERSLDVDLALALSLEACEVLRPDLRLLVMSATLTAEPVAALLADGREADDGARAPILRAEGRSFPVDIQHADRAYARPVSGTRPQGQRAALAGAVAAACRDALAAQPGDVLVFLPGAAEIDAAIGALRAGPPLSDDIRLLPLHARLSHAEQQTALRGAPDGIRHVVLATNIAESSLTIPGIGAVVDSGLAREPRFDPNSALTRLVTVPIARDSAEQRAGRAGRLGPGWCWRLWTRSEHQGRSQTTGAEIMSADLTSLALQLACWGTRDASELRWLNRPPAGALSQARELLRRLGLIDEAGAPTALGRESNGQPLHPRLAAMVLAGERGRRACLLAALLSEGDPLRESTADIESRLATLDARARTDRATEARLQRIRALARELASRGESPQPAGGGPHSPGGRPGALVGGALRRDVDESPQPAGGDTLGTGPLLARAFPDRAALPSGAPGRYVLANGRAVSLDPADPLAGSEALIVADATSTAGDTGRVRLALQATRSELASWFGDQVTEQTSVCYDAARDVVSATSDSRLGALLLDSRPLKNPPAEQVSAALAEGVRRGGLARLPMTDALSAYRARCDWLAELVPELKLPKMDDTALLAEVKDWLAPYLAGLTRLRALEPSLLADALRSRLDAPQARALEEHAPSRVTLANGTSSPVSLRVRYQAGEPPSVEAKLQRLFGVRDVPQLAMGRARLRVKLLSPAGRPVQVTDDLAGFWTGSYAAVRKEMRGRYPKHRWPEDPRESPPDTGRRARTPRDRS